MNMPRFTAESSLYKSSGHYRTGRNSDAVNISAQMINSIHPVMENIHVHGCAPGSYLVDYDDGTWDCLPLDPLTEPSGGGGGDAGSPGVPSNNGGGGGGGVGKPPKRPPNRPHKTKTPPKKYRPKSGQPCYVEESVTSGEVTITDVYLNGKYFSTREVGDATQKMGTIPRIATISGQMAMATKESFVVITVIMQSNPHRD